MRPTLRQTNMNTFLAVPIAVLLVAGACASDNTASPPTSGVDPPVQTTTVGGPLDPVGFEPSPGATRAEVSTDAPTPVLVAALNDTGFELLRSQPSTENLVLSPTSIGHAVLMVRDAADSSTGTAIDRALSFPEGIAAHEAWNAIDNAIAQSNETNQAIDASLTPVVALAGRVWPDVTTSPDQTWIDLLSSHHGADVEAIDRGWPEDSRVLVNDWVSEQTNGLIPELLPNGFIDDQTVLILTDAVYFKAQWRQIFGKYGEVNMPFHLLDGSTTPISMLRDLEQSGPRGIGSGYIAAELPYLGDDYSMLLVIPDEGRFDEIRSTISSDFLTSVDAGLTSGPYELLMPEWNTTSQLDLLPWLTDIGVAPGNYPGIAPGAFLAGGVHAADIAVDEIGTIAAAATALSFATSGPPDPEITIAADRPFIYVIRHVDTGLALFVGQVTNPEG